MASKLQLRQSNPSKDSCVRRHQWHQATKQSSDVHPTACARLILSIESRQHSPACSPMLTNFEEGCGKAWGIFQAEMPIAGNTGYPALVVAISCYENR